MYKQIPTETPGWEILVFLRREEGIIGKNVCPWFIFFFFPKGPSSLSRESQGNQEVSENSLAHTTLQHLLQTYPILVCLIIHKNRANTSSRDFKVSRLLAGCCFCSSLFLLRKGQVSGSQGHRTQLLIVLLRMLRASEDQSPNCQEGFLPIARSRASLTSLFLRVYTTGFRSGVMTV